MKSFRTLILFFLATETILAATLENAQKAYVSGNWKSAAESFESVCPALDASKRSECALWGVLARSQIGNSKDFSIAKKRLDSLIFATPDTLPVISDLYMTRAQFELYLKRSDLSQKSLKTAFAKAQPHQIPVIYQVCQSLYKAAPNDSVLNLCAEIEKRKTNPAETSSSSGAGSSSSILPIAESSSSETIGAASSSSFSPDSSVLSSASAFALSSSESVPLLTNEKSSEFWSLQLGAFGIRSNAEMLVNSLQSKKIEARIEESHFDDRTLFLVQTGKFETREQAVEYGEKVLLPQHLEYQPVKKP